MQVSCLKQLACPCLYARKTHSVLNLHLLFHQVVGLDMNEHNAMWGKLASEILMQNWDDALEDLNKLRSVIDGSVSFQVSLVCICIGVPQ